MAELKSIKIKNSYSTWSVPKMTSKIMNNCYEKYNTPFADKVLNRSFDGMYIEWWLHNIGYWLTLPFVKNGSIKTFNERFKDVDLEEHL